MKKDILWEMKRLALGEAGPGGLSARVLDEGEALAVKDGLRVVKGSNQLGIKSGAGGKVQKLEVQADKSVKLVILFNPPGVEKVLWARHENRLSDDEISLNTGDPTKSIKISRIPAGQPVPGFVTMKKPAAPPTEAVSEALREGSKVMPVAAMHECMEDIGKQLDECYDASIAHGAPGMGAMGKEGQLGRTLMEMKGLCGTSVSILQTALNTQGQGRRVPEVIGTASIESQHGDFNVTTEAMNVSKTKAIAKQLKQRAMDMVETDTADREALVGKFLSMLRQMPELAKAVGSPSFAHKLGAFIEANAGMLKTEEPAEE